MMMLASKYASVLPLLPLPGAAYFLIRTLTEKRVFKQILFMTACNACLLIFLSSIVAILYLKTLLEEERSKQSKKSRRNVMNREETQNEDIATLEELSESIPENSEPSTDSIKQDTLKEEGTDGNFNSDIAISEEEIHTEKSCDHRMHDSSAEVQVRPAPDTERNRRSVEIMNKALISNYPENVPALLKESSEYSSIYLLDPEESEIWINEMTIMKNCTKRQLDKQGVGALYQLCDETNMSLIDGYKYEYVMISAPCRVEQLHDGSYRVTVKGKLYFRRC